MTQIKNNINTYQTNTDYVNDMSKDFPNISYIQASDEVIFKKETRVVCKYNVTDISTATKLSYTNNSSFSKAEIDGVEQIGIPYSFQFSTTGEHIVKYTLSDSTKLNSLTFADISTLTSVYLPDTITTFAKTNHFQNCVNLVSLNIPKGITKISDGFCSECTSLASIYLPEGLLNFGSNSFKKCSSLTSVTIPSTVTYMKYPSIFEYCTSLTSVTCLPTTPPEMNLMYQFDSTNNCPIYVPSESVAAYKAASGWSKYADRIFAIPTE